MGAFDFNGVEALEISLKQVAELSDSEHERIVMAGANLIRDKLEQYLLAHHKRTGELAASLRAKYYSFDGTALVSPYGKTTKKGRRILQQGHSGSGAMKNRSRHHGSTSTSSMMEIGWYLEYGTPRMSAKYWMETSNEQSMSDFDKVMVEAWNEHLQKAGF